MKKNILLSVCAFVFCCGTVSLRASTVDLQFDQYNRAYAEGRTAEALQGYQTLLNNHQISASLLFNLANASYRQGDVARAVLNYERARLLKPSDPDIRANLDLVRRSSGLTVAEDPFWKRALLFFSLDQWAWFGFSAFLLASLISCIRGVWQNFWPARPCPQQLFNFSMVAALLLILPAAAGLFVQSRDLDRAVVMHNEVMLKLSPFDKAEAVGELHAGETVRPLKEFDNYVLVENQSGRRGWVGKSQIETLLPQS